MMAYITEIAAAVAAVAATILGLLWRNSEQRVRNARLEADQAKKHAAKVDEQINHVVRVHRELARKSEEGAKAIDEARRQARDGARDHFTRGVRD